MSESIKNCRGRVNGAALLPWGIALLSLVCWSSTLTYSFVWDDFPTIVTNRSLEILSNLGRAFTSDFWGLHEIPARSGYWRPIPTVIYTLAYQISGPSPIVFHLLNWVAHAGVAAASVMLLMRLGLSVYGALLGGVFYALHSIHAETVSFVSALPDLLAALFGLLALLAWTSRRKGGPILGFLCYGLALLSKESAVIFPAALFLIWNAEERESDRKILFGSVAMAAIYLIVHSGVTGELGNRSPWGDGLPSHIATIVTLFPYALSLAIFPVTITPTRTFPIIEGFGNFVFLGALATFAVFLLAIWTARRRWPVGFRAGALFLLFWLPVSNLIPLEGLIADRYLYLPALGVALLIGATGEKLFDRFRPPRTAVVAFGALFLLYGWAQTRRSEVWKDERSLWAHAVKVSPDSALAWNEWGRLTMSESAFNKALELRPGYPEAERNLISLLYWTKRYSEAWPRIENYVSHFPSDAEGWDLRGAVAQSLGMQREAIDSSERAVKLAPQNWKFLFNLSTTYLAIREPRRAFEVLERARRFAPDRQPVLSNLAAAHVELGETEEALSIYREILRRWPDHEPTRRNVSLLEERKARVKP